MTTIGNAIRHGFTGHEHLDSVGLIHMNGRVYDPVVGRFLSADPFIDWGLGTQGVNRYGYVGNNPLSFTDPSGYTCTSNPSLSDEEQAAEMTRCADAFDAGGWGPNNGNQSRYCDLLGDCRLAYGYPVDFGVESRNGQPASLFGVPLSLAQQDALNRYEQMVARGQANLAAGGRSRDRSMGATFDCGGEGQIGCGSWGGPVSLPVGSLVSSSRLSLNLRGRAGALLGVTGGVTVDTVTPYTIEGGLQTHVETLNQLVLGGGVAMTIDLRLLGPGVEGNLITRTGFCLVGKIGGCFYHEYGPERGWGIVGAWGVGLEAALFRETVRRVPLLPLIDQASCRPDYPWCH